MARGFTKQEKENIRLQLIEAGRKLFGKFGLKKTNIAQLTSAAGIAPATFYQFFHSKEDLYFYIFQEEISKVQALLLEEMMNHQSTSQSIAIQKMLLEGMDWIKRNPFLEQLFTGNSLLEILQTRSREEIDEHISKDYHQFTPVIEQLQEKGKVISFDPKVLTVIIQLYFLLHEHRDKFGATIFDQAVKLLAQWIGDGFTNGK